MPFKRGIKIKSCSVCLGFAAVELQKGVLYLDDE